MTLDVKASGRVALEPRIDEDPRFRDVRRVITYAERVFQTWPIICPDVWCVVQNLAERMLAGSSTDPQTWGACFAWVASAARSIGEARAQGGRRILEEGGAHSFAYSRIADGEAEQAAGWLARYIWGSLNGGTGVDLARQAIDQCLVAALEAEAARHDETFDETNRCAHRRALLRDLAARWEEAALGIAQIRC